MIPLTESEEACLAAAGAVLRRRNISHLLIDLHTETFKVKRFFHGWRNGEGENLADAVRNLPDLTPDEYASIWEAEAAATPDPQKSDALRARAARIRATL